MSKITRRNLLKQSPAALVAVSIPVGSAVAALPAEAAPAENPELIAAYERFVVARAEVAAAEDALEWLVDEWRHLWPLAPDQILGFANADDYSEGAERDIAGRIIKRDTAELGKKFTAEWVQRTRRTCFSVLSPEHLREVIANWERPRTGKTEKALARNRAYQAKFLAEYRQKLLLSEDYYAETARLRQASGVEAVKDRISAAKADLRSASLDISKAHAVTPTGLCMKAEALKADDLVAAVSKQFGILAELVRFIDATLGVIGRASV